MFCSRVRAVIDGIDPGHTLNLLGILAHVK